MGRGIPRVSIFGQFELESASNLKMMGYLGYLCWMIEVMMTSELGSNLLV